MIDALVDIAISVIINLAEYFILLFLMQYICSAHIKLHKRNLWICAGLCTACVIVACVSENELIGYTYMFIAIILTVLLFSTKKIKDLLLFFPASAIYMTLTLMPETILEMILPAMGGTIVLTGLTLTYTAIATDVLLLITLIFLRHILTKYETIVPFSTKEIIGSIGILFFSMVDIMLLLALNSIQLKPAIYYMWVVIFVGAFLLIVGYYYYNLVDTRIRIYRHTLTKAEAEYLQVQLDALQEVKENEDQVKRIRHDLKNHLEIIQKLCEEGNLKELKKYTEQLHKDTNISGNSILTGNKIGDMVVHSKMQMATEHNIRFTFTGTLESLEKMEAPDICGLLANAYDNAIEACASIPNAHIHTEVRTTTNYTVIRISNPVTENIRIRNNNIATTKKEKSSHGYGLNIMKRIARKYNGSCTFQCENNEFSVKIMLLT